MTLNDTKERKFSVGWCVAHGPDRSHLVNVEWFNTLRDARARLAQVEPAKLWRHDWDSPWNAAKGGISLVSSRGC